MASQTVVSGYLFISLGLVTTFIKINRRKNNWFLFRKNAWIAYCLMIIACLLLALGLVPGMVHGQPPAGDLKVILIRHGEKPEKGGNLTCRGLNRSLQLPSVIQRKFGVPDFTYVPALKMGDKTSHSRMFETVIPLAVKYNLAINSKFDEKDVKGLAAEIKTEKGTVLVVWEHSMIPGLVHALGISDDLNWPGEDYDSIWIVTYSNGIATLTKDKEGIVPSDECP